MMTVVAKLGIDEKWAPVMIQLLQQIIPRKSYSSRSGILSITLTPRTLLSQISSPESGTGNKLDENSILKGSHCSSMSNSSVIITESQDTSINVVPYGILEDSSIAAIQKQKNPHVFKNIRYDCMYGDDKYSKGKEGIALMEYSNGELRPYFDAFQNEYE